MNSSMWLISTLEIRPGASAVLGGNTVAFLFIHILSIFLNIISITCCLVIVSHIVWTHRKTDILKLEISSRFQIYFGIGDIIFAIFFLFEHSYLLVTQTLLEDKSAQTILGLLIVIPFAWTHFFRCAVSIFAYMKITKGVQVSMGCWEWKVHVGVLITTIILTTIYISFDMIGSNGYWTAYNITTRNGLIGASLTSFLLLSIAFIYLFCYWSIKKRVTLNRNRLHNYNQRNQDTIGNESPRQQVVTTGRINSGTYHPTTLKCLTTHVIIGMCIYCPLAIFAGALTFLNVTFGVTSPVLCGLMVIVATSNGWANVLAYFHNERIKKNRLKCNFKR